MAVPVIDLERFAAKVLAARGVAPENAAVIAAEGVELPQDVRADLDAIAAALGIEPLGS